VDRAAWLQVLHFFYFAFLYFQFTHYSIFLHALYTHHTARGKRHMHSTVLILGSTRAFSLYSLMVNASFTYSTLYPPSLRRSLVSVVAQRSYSVQVFRPHTEASIFMCDMAPSGVAWGCALGRRRRAHAPCSNIFTAAKNGLVTHAQSSPILPASVWGAHVCMTGELGAT
jgi:hypothetical protein